MSHRLHLTLLLALAPSAGLAQPNPFEAYEASRRTEGPAAAGPTANELATGRLARGAVLLGGGAVFSYTSATNELESGKDSDNSTLFMRLTPSIGYFVTDRIELGFAPGLLVRQLDRGGADTTTDDAWLLALTGRYFHPLTRNFSFFGGGGVGGSFGQSTRGLMITDDQGREREVTEETSTRAFMLSADVGAAYLIRNRVQLRAGLDLAWLVGNETVDSLNKDLSISTFNTGLGISLHYLF